QSFGISTIERFDLSPRRGFDGVDFPTIVRTVHIGVTARRGVLAGTAVGVDDVRETLGRDEVNVTNAARNHYQRAEHNRARQTLSVTNPQIVMDITDGRVWRRKCKNGGAWGEPGVDVPAARCGTQREPVQHRRRRHETHAAELTAAARRV